MTRRDRSPGELPRACHTETGLWRELDGRTLSNDSKTTNSSQLTLPRLLRSATWKTGSWRKGRKERR